MRALTTIVRNAIDGGFASDPRFADRRQLLRLRTVRGAMIESIVAAPFTAFFFARLGGWSLAAVILVAALITLGSLRALRLGARLGTVAHLHISLGVVTFFVLQASLGGLATRGQGWVFVPAVYAGLVLGARSALAYGLVGLLQTIFFGALASSGVRLQ